jgi:hypothetical protein
MNLSILQQHPGKPVFGEKHIQVKPSSLFSPKGEKNTLSDWPSIPE